MFPGSAAQHIGAAADAPRPSTAMPRKIKLRRARLAAARAGAEKPMAHGFLLCSGSSRKRGAHPSSPLFVGASAGCELGGKRGFGKSARSRWRT